MAHKVEELKEHFEQVYRKIIAPNLDSLEKYRLEKKRKYDMYKVTSFFTTPICVLFIILCQIKNNGEYSLTFNIIKASFIILAIVFVIIAGLVLYRIYTISNEFRMKAKELFLGKILSIFGKFRISKSSIVELDTIQRLGMYKLADYKSDDDNIIGSYKESPVLFIETRLTHETGSSKNRRTVTDFDGLIIGMKFKKKFEGMCVLYDKKDKMVGSLGDHHYSRYIPDTKSYQKEKLEKIQLEDVAFNEQYTVYSDNQVEARYILTPSFMEKVKEIKNRFGAKYANISFCENEIYLFLNNVEHSRAAVVSINSISVQLGNSKKDNHGFFEMGDIKKTVLDKELYRKTFFEIVDIFSFIDFINGEE